MTIKFTYDALSGDIVMRLPAIHLQDMLEVVHESEDRDVSPAPVVTDFAGLAQEVVDLLNTNAVDTPDYEENSYMPIQEITDKGIIRNTFLSIIDEITTRGSKNIDYQEVQEVSDDDGADTAADGEKFHLNK